MSTIESGSKRVTKSQTLNRQIYRVLRISKVDDSAPKQAEAQRLFSFAMVISGLRCILSYLILPILLPALGLGATASLGAAIGIPVGVVALFFDVKGIRRFWVANYRYKVQMTVIYLMVIGLVSYLVIRDIVSLF
ncbi:MAG: hypothetical protein HKL82_12240 [Acidimicrobiaceae bacterium]|nr:hypothetical protein [Acidimicrobiaceae bacterium]